MKLEDASSFVVKGHAKRIQEAVETVRRVVRVQGPRAVQEAVDATSPLPVDRGTYRRSFRYDDIPKGIAITNSAPYASVIEHGRRPGARQPPIAAIEDWVRRKKLVSAAGWRKSTSLHFGGRIFETERSRKRRSRKDYEREVKQAAFMIARAIGKKGITAKHVIRRAMARLKLEIQEALSANR